MEKNDNLTRNKPILNKKSPEGFLLAYNQSTKINLLGFDTIVNSPSFSSSWGYRYSKPQKGLS